MAGHPREPVAGRHHAGRPVAGLGGLARRVSTHHNHVAGHHYAEHVVAGLGRFVGPDGADHRTDQVSLGRWRWPDHPAGHGAVVPA